MAIEVTHFSDPGCPWAYSASPAMVTLRWRYGDGLRWRLVVIGLTESAEQYVRRGYTPARAAQGYHLFRRFGMPFSTEPKARIAATSRACRAIVAVRLAHPGREQDAFRALQLMQFTSTRLLDDDDDLRDTLVTLDGIDAAAIVAAIDAAQTISAYEDDRAEARTAAGSPTEAQGKAAASDGPVRYTAPSLVFERDGRRLEGGGFQPLEAYDVLLANLDPSLDRTAPPEDPLAALQRFQHGLTTQEVAAILAGHNLQADAPAAETRLIELVAEGHARRVGLADDALWLAA